MSGSPSNRSTLARALVKGVVFLLTLTAAGLLIKYVLGSVDENWIDARVRGQGATGLGLFVAMGMLFTAVGMPRQAIAFLAGYAFGFVEGTLFGLAAAAGGCTLAFSYSRLLGQRVVKRRFSRRLEKIDGFLADHPFSMTLLIRLLPVGSNLVTNLVAGVSSAPAIAFIGGSTLGYIPQTMVFALAGSGITLETGWRIALSIVLFLLSGLLGAHLYRRLRRDRSLGADLDEQPID